MSTAKHFLGKLFASQVSEHFYNFYISILDLLFVSIMNIIFEHLSQIIQLFFRFMS